MELQYNEFLKGKIKLHKAHGFKVERSSLPDTLLDHAKDTVVWALDKGCALIASSFGMTKTRTAIEMAKQIHARNSNAPVLIICPLGVKKQFQQYDGPIMGVDFIYVRNRDEQHGAESDFHITNYERVRDGDMDLSMYQAVFLDEGSCLRSLGSDTTQRFCHLFKATTYKFVFTATPSPNEYLELINYADFLGVMDRGQALTRFFQRDSLHAGNLTLHPQHADDFWLWFMSWAIVLTKPSDLGYSDKGYELPRLNVHYHEVNVDAEKYGLNVDDWDGQIAAFPETAGGLQEAASIKRKSIDERLAKTLSIMKGAPLKTWVIWHLLESERDAIEKGIPDVVSVYGSQSLEVKEKHIMDFSDGKIQFFASKPEICGSGPNFQYACSDAIFMSVNDKFNDFLQALHRIYRFRQVNECNVHIVYATEEQPVIDRMKIKWQQHNDLQRIMTDLVKKYGLSQQVAIERLTRTFGCERRVLTGKDFTWANNDNVLEIKHIKDNEVGLHFSSWPFGNHYEYSASYNDFGHNDSNESFFRQMDFLTPEIFRTLSPGRNLILHVKDRPRYSTMTGTGSFTLDRFSDKCADHCEKHGFLFSGRITIPTDVVRENAQTYRLGWTEKCKDGSSKGCGSPEYLLIFRKPQTDLSSSRADIPVVKSKHEFTRGKWQILAEGYWKTAGNRLLTPEEVAQMDPKRISQYFHAWSVSHHYDYDYHRLVAEACDAANKLPSGFELLRLHTEDEYVWTDINYMHGLNAQQNKMKAEKHICPLPFDIVDRVIDNWSMKGDLVCDTFGGLGTVPLRAVKKGRRGYGMELNPDYWKWGGNYLTSQEAELSTPTLFDLITEEDTLQKAS